MMFLTNVTTLHLIRKFKSFLRSCIHILVLENRVDIVREIRNDPLATWSLTHPFGRWDSKASER